MAGLMEREVVVATMEVVGADTVLLLTEVAAVDLATLVVVRTLAMPQCCKARRVAAPLQCCPLRPRSPDMFLGWAWDRRVRTQERCP